ncbi:Gas vesicle synthesis protein GvpL/GvpF [Desulfocicer vacuolatum DSM 3385]|uniref:Gas vesicle synthesis protein GvpL/GvpF n=1 Tax=Desulfocicer vacuolatum DSM 3385 TaxID=1121400 RepID=A0A1W2BEC1_9BACT|nr:GvpL/GvpF family gas vesicle protein [Desulfocicer vacuolatum]SMC71100.1 Gas vesicle synthesis protein GvpL/GvpF [Desulfocicer vacuolatum DSM 3385]
MEKKKAVYLYCVTRANKFNAPGITGIDANTPVCFEHLENFVAVYNIIPLNTFVGTSAEENMKNIDWIGPRAMRHENVIERMMQESSVYPARFATLFSSMENLRETLHLKSGLISRFLNQTQHKCEYSLKGFINRKQLLEFLIKTKFKQEKKQLDGLSPGKKYFAQHQFNKKVETGINQWIKRRCGIFLDHLTKRNPEVSPRELFTEKTEKNNLEMMFNLAFLIHNDSKSAFLQEISQAEKEFSQTGISLVVSGPWAPYSFCKTTRGEGL